MSAAVEALSGAGPTTRWSCRSHPRRWRCSSGCRRELRERVRRARRAIPDAERLFPHAYLDPTEEEAEAEYEALVQPDLLRQRLDALELVTSSFTRAVEAGEWREIALTPDDVGAWLGVLNDTRLVLGTRLEVTEDARDVDDDDPNVVAYRIYDWLTYLQGELDRPAPRLTRTDMDDTGEREERGARARLAERVIGPRGTGRDGALPSADLCAIALARRGGAGGLRARRRDRAP